MSADRRPFHKGREVLGAMARTAVLATLPFTASVACADKQADIPQTSPTTSPRQEYSVDTLARLQAYYRDLKAVGSAKNYEGGVLTIYFEPQVHSEKPTFLLEQEGKPPMQVDTTQLQGSGPNASMVVSIIT